MPPPLWPHGDFDRESLPPAPPLASPSPPPSAGDFARICIRGTSAAAIPQRELLLVAVVDGCMLPSRENCTLRRGVVEEEEERVGVRDERYCC